MGRSSLSASFVMWGRSDPSKADLGRQNRAASTKNTPHATTAAGLETRVRFYGSWARNLPPMRTAAEYRHACSAVMFFTIRPSSVSMPSLAAILRTRRV